MISTGKGRTTCSYYLPGDSLILYASTHLGGEACPPAPAPRKDRKYLWAIYSLTSIFLWPISKGEIVNQLDHAHPAMMPKPLFRPMAKR
jgi:TolB protein